MTHAAMTATIGATLQSALTHSHKRQAATKEVSIGGGSAHRETSAWSALVAERRTLNLLCVKLTVAKVINIGQMS